MTVSIETVIERTKDSKMMMDGNQKRASIAVLVVLMEKA